MDYDDYMIESIVKEILDKLGKEVDVKANLKTWKDREDLMFGGEEESYVKVKGLKYHFDKMNILGYYYNNNYYFSISYNYFWQKPYGRYEKKEDGQIINENAEIWKPYLLELFNSLDDLKRNQEEREKFFKSYGQLIPWKRPNSYWGDKEVKHHIKELDITLVWIQVDYSRDCERNVQTFRKIYNGSNCVFDSKKNLFIPGQWQWELVKYGLAPKKQKDLATSIQEEKSFNDSIQLLRKVRKQNNRNK